MPWLQKTATNNESSNTSSSSKLFFFTRPAIASYGPQICLFNNVDTAMNVVLVELSYSNPLILSACYVTTLQVMKFEWLLTQLLPLLLLRLQLRLYGILRASSSGAWPFFLQGIASPCEKTLKRNESLTTRVISLRGSMSVSHQTHQRSK